MNKDSKIYIAGHTGLVGSALIRKLQSEGYSNLITRTRHELDLTRQVEVEDFFRSERPDHVILAAARVGGIKANNTYPAEFIYSNLAIQTNVIHSAYLATVKKLLFLGSSCIYPRECPQPMNEEYLLSGKLEPTNEPYALAKIAGIKMCQSYNRQYGTLFISAMPTNLYGPNDTFDLETSHVLPALIRKFHLAKLAARGDWEGITGDELAFGPIRKNFMTSLIAIARSNGHTIPDSIQSHALGPLPLQNAVPLWGSGRVLREFLHVDDLADAALFIMNHYDENGIVNIGTGQDISIKDLAGIIKEIVGFQGDIVYDTSKPDGTPRKLLDVSRLKSLGWENRISLREGIRKTYQWYVDRNAGC